MPTKENAPQTPLQSLFLTYDALFHTALRALVIFPVTGVGTLLDLVLCNYPKRLIDVSSRTSSHAFFKKIEVNAKAGEPGNTAALNHTSTPSPRAQLWNDCLDYLFNTGFGGLSFWVSSCLIDIPAHIVASMLATVATVLHVVCRELVHGSAVLARNCI